MAYSGKAKFGTLRTTAFGSITGSYVAVGNPFSDNNRVLYLGNSTDADLMVTTDPTVDQIFMPAASFQLYDFTANRISDIGFWLPLGTIIYVKYASGAPTLGKFWVQEIFGTFQ